MKYQKVYLTEHQTRLIADLIIKAIGTDLVDSIDEQTLEALSAYLEHTANVMAADPSQP